MIVAVEGASASGKTTWCRINARALTVWEPSPRLRRLAPQPSSEEAHRFWSEQNARRWETAQRLEARTGIAVCDTDPFKLHYYWCQWQVGDISEKQFDRAAESSRALFASGRLGLADLILMLDPDGDTLNRQKEADQTRSRMGFERHLRLREPLRLWYSAVELLEPGHVLWSVPSGIERLPNRARRVRSGIELFDRLLEIVRSIR